MDEEVTITELNAQEVVRLYEALSKAKPGSDEYKGILKDLDVLSKNLSDASKTELDHYYAADKLKAEMEMKEKELKQAKWLGIASMAEKVLGTMVSVGLAWTTLKYNIKFGPIGTKEAWSMIHKKH